MHKIRAYIWEGKGIGAFLLFALAFVASAYVAVILRTTLTESVPLMQDVADKVLPIEIKNGTVVNPENTVKVIDFNDNDSESNIENDEPKNKLPIIVIDTTQDELETDSLAPGLYLARKTLYAVKEGEVRVIKLEDNANIDLPKQDYTEGFKNIIKWTAVTVAVGVTVIAFFVFLILTLMYAWLAGVAAWINKTQLAFDARMRLSSVLFVAVYLLSEIAEYAGISFSTILFVALMFVLQILTIRKFK